MHFEKLLSRLELISQLPMRSLCCHILYDISKPALYGQLNVLCRLSDVYMHVVY